MTADGDINCVFLAAMLKIRHPELFVKLQAALISYGIKVRLLDKVRDVWAKDYAPIQVGPRQLVKFRYDPDYLKDEPGLKTGDGVVRFFRGIGQCRRSDIVLDGGNIVASSTKAILTDKIYKENPGRKRSDLRAKLQKLLQVDELVVVPKEPFDRIGHADGMVRFIDEYSVLVNDYSKIDPGFGERLFKVLRRHRLAIDALPYFCENQSVAGIPSAVGCYINFLRTEKVLIAPVYGTKDDHDALKKLEAVFPGLPIVPLDSTELARKGGVLNCVGAGFRVPAHGSEVQTWGGHCPPAKEGCIILNRKGSRMLSRTSSDFGRWRGR